MRVMTTRMIGKRGVSQVAGGVITGCIRSGHGMRVPVGMTRPPVM